MHHFNINRYCNKLVANRNYPIKREKFWIKCMSMNPVLAAKPFRIIHVNSICKAGEDIFNVLSSERLG